MHLDEEEEHISEDDEDEEDDLDKQELEEEERESHQQVIKCPPRRISKLEAFPARAPSASGTFHELDSRCTAAVVRDEGDRGSARAD